MRHRRPKYTAAAVDIGSGFRYETPRYDIGSYDQCAIPPMPPTSPARRRFAYGRVRDGVGADSMRVASAAHAIAKISAGFRRQYACQKSMSFSRRLVAI